MKINMLSKMKGKLVATALNNEIIVSVNGLNGHDKHEGDIIPAPEGGCPASPQDKKPKNNKP